LTPVTDPPPTDSEGPVPAPDVPKLFRVILPVSNIDLAAQFYSRLLGLPGKRVSPGRHYFDCGGTLLACFDPRADTDPFDLGPNPDHLYFAVRDLEAVHARAVELKAEIRSPIGKRPWGEVSFYLRDPFGNKICFVDRTTMFTG
jgi:catechol 2,3-dioxygenase-like lactoylglutathione lyase family enzyme